MIDTVLSWFGLVRLSRVIGLVSESGDAWQHTAAIVAQVQASHRNEPHRVILRGPNEFIPVSNVGTPTVTQGEPVNPLDEPVTIDWRSEPIEKVAAAYGLPLQAFKGWPMPPGKPQSLTMDIDPSSLDVPPAEPGNPLDEPASLSGTYDLVRNAPPAEPVEASGDWALLADLRHAGRLLKQARQRIAELEAERQSVGEMFGKRCTFLDELTGEPRIGVLLTVELEEGDGQ